MAAALALALTTVACAPAPQPLPRTPPVTVTPPGDPGPLWEGTVRRERSLAWTDAALLDDPTVVGLARVIGAAAAQVAPTGGGGGALFDAWLRRFATTAHSERAGPARLADHLRADLGADPSTWNLDDAPFKVTGVHNRVDLMGAFDDGTPHCGQLRVSLASTDPILRPFHLLFLFSQPALDDDGEASDFAADGTLTCERTALAWARLSDLDDPAFLDAARALLDEGLAPARFLLAESVELTVSPWEWRQWTPTGDPAVPLDNPPLFEQLDVEHLNQPGPARAALLAFVDANADALDARTLKLPDGRRAPSVRVVQGAPWVPLDLTGAAATAAHPSLRQHLEIVGCAACHTADADFVQTRDDRTFSPFYKKELLARGALLGEILAHRRRVIPFGPLQDAPVLPP